MADRHLLRPVCFRPPENDRAWLLAHAEETGRPVNVILAEALAAYRQRRTTEPGGTGHDQEH